MARFLRSLLALLLLNCATQSVRAQTVVRETALSPSSSGASAASREDVWLDADPRQESSSLGRHTHLPPPPGWTAAEFATLGSSPESEPLDPRDDMTVQTGRLSSHKNGFFQKFSLRGAWMNRTAEDNLGLSEFNTFVTVAVPLPSRDFPMLITTGFDADVFNGPKSVDLPPQVYDVYIDFMWLPKLHDRLLGILAVSPGVYSDFNDVENDAWRTKGKALVRYDWIPDRLQLMAGILYLDRKDVNWLPAGGLIWDPNDNVHYEIVFPRPKFSHRIMHTGMHEDWVYLGAEFGGDTWSVRHSGGEPDLITLRDWRIYLGLERKRAGGAGHHIEVGYVFSRVIQFDSGLPDYTSGATIMIRAGIQF